MAFEKQAPTWSAPGVEPPESKKQEGWQVNDKPPAAWWNWFMTLTAESLQEIQQKAAEKSDITALNGEIDGLKQSGVDGKNRLETAIIAKEGTVSKQGQVATFAELDTGIHSIPTGTDTSDATAAAGDLISGKTAYGPNGKITGTIPDRGAGGMVTPGATDQTKAAGRYTTAITIKGVPVPAASVLTGTTIAGTAGNMPNRSAEDVHMPGLEKTVWAGDRYFIRPPAGYYNGSTWVTAVEQQLIAANLRAGVNVGGLIGSLIEGKQYYEANLGTIPASGYLLFNTGFYPRMLTVTSAPTTERRSLATTTFQVLPYMQNPYGWYANLQGSYSYMSFRKGDGGAFFDEDVVNGKMNVMEFRVVNAQSAPWYDVVVRAWG